MPGHGAEIQFQEDDAQDEDERQQGVEIVGDGPEEEFLSIESGALGEGGDGGGPTGDGGDHADGSGSGVDEVGQFCAGDPVGVRDGAHDAAHGQAVEIVVDENQHPQEEGSQAGARAALHVLVGPLSEGRRRAGLVDEGGHDPQHHQEDEDARPVGDGGQEALVDHGVEGLHQVEIAAQEAAHEDADEEGGVDLLGDQRQSNGDHRGENRPACSHEGVLHRRGLPRHLLGDSLLTHEHGGEGKQGEKEKGRQRREGRCSDFHGEVSKGKGGFGLQGEAGKGRQAAGWRRKRRKPQNISPLSRFPEIPGIPGKTRALSRPSPAGALPCGGV